MAEVFTGNEKDTRKSGCPETVGMSVVAESVLWEGQTEVWEAVALPWGRLLQRAQSTDRPKGQSQVFASEEAAGAAPLAAERPADPRLRDASVSLIPSHGLAFAATTQGNGPTDGRG